MSFKQAEEELEQKLEAVRQEAMEKWITLIKATEMKRVPPTTTTDGNATTEYEATVSSKGENGVASGEIVSSTEIMPEITKSLRKRIDQWIRAQDWCEPRSPNHLIIDNIRYESFAIRIEWRLETILDCILQLAAAREEEEEVMV